MDTLIVVESFSTSNTFAAEELALYLSFPANVATTVNVALVVGV